MAQTMSGQWSHPIEETNGNARPPAKRQDTFGSQDAGLKTVRRMPSDSYNIMSDSEQSKVRRQSFKATNASATRKRSRNTLKGKEKPPEHPDDSQWIHRDKLAQIEIQEMVEAGINPRMSRRSVSAGPGASARSSRSVSRSRRNTQDEPPSEEYMEEMPTGYPGDFDDYERKRISTIPAASEEDFDPYHDTEFRTPEEVAAEHGSNRSTLIRPSTSRIPISKASPVPVPFTVVGRDSPLPRSRHGSGSISGNWEDMQYAHRARTGSVGSHVLLDEDGGVQTPSRPTSSYLRSSDDNSPPKARVPTKATPKSGGRKGSTPNAVTDRPASRGKASSKGSSGDRPTSRSGPQASRPSTSHKYAPEGDPPWISSMYKPDPRLPPDQQMLPTHAKRMMQEQWEREGKTGTAYDPNFKLLNDDEFPPQKATPSLNTSKPQPPLPLNIDKPPQQLDPESVRKPSPQLQQLDTNIVASPTSANISNAWPLTPNSANDQRGYEATSSRPGTSGGLKLTPTIPMSPTIEKSPGLPAAPQNQNAPLRMPDYDDEKMAKGKKEGGCACCVVM